LANKGDLVYVPAESQLWKLNEKGAPHKQKVTTKPQNVLVTSPSPHASWGQQSVQVLIEGEYWFVNEREVYPVRDNMKEATNDQAS